MNQLKKRLDKFEKEIKKLREELEENKLWQCPKCKAWSHEFYVCRKCLFDRTAKDGGRAYLEHTKGEKMKDKISKSMKWVELEQSEHDLKTSDGTKPKKVFGLSFSEPENELVAFVVNWGGGIKAYLGWIGNLMELEDDPTFETVEEAKKAALKEWIDWKKGDFISYDIDMLEEVRETIDSLIKSFIHLQEAIRLSRDPQ